MHRPQRAGAVPIAYALLATLILALSAWQAQLSRDSTGAHWSVAVLVVTAFGAALVLGRGRQDQTTRGWVARNLHFVRTWRTQSRSAVVSALVWAVLIGGVVAWDLVSFAFQSRALPTLSYFIGHVTRYAVGRGLLFAAWLGVGAYLVSAWRAVRRR
ncbi:MAG: hypothetical protein ABSH29_00770 [Acidimicrobiales bacterium]